MKQNARLVKEYGDYQTPESFTDLVCGLLGERISPDVILEPTFGLGNFILSSLRAFPRVRQVFGIEVNAEYVTAASRRIGEANTGRVDIELYSANIFTFDFAAIKARLNPADHVLILGNPPWLTAAELTAIEGKNSPVKQNFKGLSGLDALTGKSNFDLAECIILQMLQEFAEYNCHLAMLCKNVVARNIVRDLPGYDLNLAAIEIYEFAARDVFAVNCEASLLLIRSGTPRTSICDVYALSEPAVRKRSFGWSKGNFIADLDQYRCAEEIDGISPWEWRQGIKHDCTRVMELSHKTREGFYCNGYGKCYHLEDAYVYPLLKSSDLRRVVVTAARKNLIVTQTRLNDDTRHLCAAAPQLWAYLQEYAPELDHRKSGIYKHAPRFSIFGVGEYSFKPYKVAISGFYKVPCFALVYNRGAQTVMLDDTCYFLGFDEYQPALITMLLLNSPLVQSLIQSIAFVDAKRPYTKEVLMRIDLRKAAGLIAYSELLQIAESLELPLEFTAEDYHTYRQQLNVGK